MKRLIFSIITPIANILDKNLEYDNKKIELFLKKFIFLYNDENIKNTLQFRQ